MEHSGSSPKRTKRNSIESPSRRFVWTEPGRVGPDGSECLAVQQPQVKHLSHKPFNDISRKRSAQELLDGTPRLRRSFFSFFFSDHKLFEESRMVTAAGKKQLEGDAAGAITGANIEKIGVKCHSKVPIGVVLGVKDAAFSWWFRLRYKVLLSLIHI